MMLHFKSFKKQYGKSIVLDIPDFELADGGYWLQAENGQGKSTLLRSLSGVIPFSGEIWLDNHNLQKEKINQRVLINYAEPEPLFPDFLTGMELINFYTQTKRGNYQEALKLAEKLRINGNLSQAISTYSSGMLKKLSLVLVFIGQPKWILLDEPLITIDQQAIAVIMDILKNLRSNGFSFIITSHQSIEAEFDFMQRLTISDKSLKLFI